MYFSKIKINNFRALNNQEIILGKYLTVLSGFNGTGKSTVLGLLANCSELKQNQGKPIHTKQFKAEFHKLFRGSNKFDLSGSNKVEIFVNNDDDTPYSSRKCRITWQNNRERFRIIPYEINADGIKTNDRKFSYPVLYLGLSRLYPLGEISEKNNNKNEEGINITKRELNFYNEDYKNWFIDTHNGILSISDEKINHCDTYDAPLLSKYNKIGVSTSKYDSDSNSSGQDNLGQILLSILSFRYLREKTEHKSGGLLLIDEIDATLHPSAQEKLIKILISAAKIYNFQVVVTTHSLTIIKYACTKNRIQNDINNIELSYFNNANINLKINRNPKYEDIKAGLLIKKKSDIIYKIKIYSEDDEARWFIKHLLNDEKIFDIKNVRIGCNALISLMNADNEYFSKCIIVFDGDVKESTLTKIDVLIKKNKNYIKLPSAFSVSPENEIYNYLKNLDKDHAYWEDYNESDFNRRYILENGPDSYNEVKERDRAKKWFNENIRSIEETNVIEYWKKDNKEIIDAFIKEFTEIEKRISDKLMINK